MKPWDFTLLCEPEQWAAMQSTAITLPESQDAANAGISTGHILLIECTDGKTVKRRVTGVQGLTLQVEPADE